MRHALNFSLEEPNTDFQNLKYIEKSIKEGWVGGSINKQKLSLEFMTSENMMSERSHAAASDCHDGECMLSFACQ